MQLFEVRHLVLVHPDCIEQVSSVEEDGTILDTAIVAVQHQRSNVHLLIPDSSGSSRKSSHPVENKLRR